MEHTFQVAYREPRSLVERLASLEMVPEIAEPWAKIMGLIQSGAERQEIRTQIDLVESALLKTPQADHILEHSFADGLYIRLAGILPGCLFTTPIHKIESVLTLLSGRLVMITEDGVQAFTPPCYMITKPGTKRLILALDEVRATTVHPNPDNERDLAVLESRIYADSFREVELELAEEAV